MANRHGEEQIRALADNGCKVFQFKNQPHFRINDALDLYPVRHRYHVLKTGERGSYQTPLGIAMKVFGADGLAYKVRLISNSMQADAAADPFERSRGLLKEIDMLREARRRSLSMTWQTQWVDANELEVNRLAGQGWQPVGVVTEGYLWWKTTKVIIMKRLA